MLRKKSQVAKLAVRRVTVQFPTRCAATVLIGGEARLWPPCHRELLPVSEVVRPCQRFHDLGDFKPPIFSFVYGEIVSRGRVSKLAGLQILRISTVGSISTEYIFLFTVLFRRRSLRPREADSA